MQIAININDEGKVTTVIQDIKSTDALGVFSSTELEAVTIPIGEISEAQSFDGGSALALENKEEAKLRQTILSSSEAVSIDGGGAPLI